MSVLTIEDAGGSRAAIALDQGFNCFRFTPRLQQRSVEVLWSADGFAAGRDRPSGSGIPLLFPFAGRIAGGRLDWQGCSYFPRGDDGCGNAIHGFIYNRPWRLIEQQSDQVTGEFQASRDAPDVLEQWPADFRVRVQYSIAGRRLTGRYEFHNPDDQPLPWAFGTHPYFRLPGNVAAENDCHLSVPVSEQWELRELIPTGMHAVTSLCRRMSQGFPLANTGLDDVFQLATPPDGLSRSVLRLPEEVVIRQQWTEGFPFCVVYIPPHRQAVCVEPYTALPDAARLAAGGIDAGWRQLEPGQSVRLEVQIEVLTAAEVNEGR